MKLEFSTLQEILDKAEDRESEVWTKVFGGNEYMNIFEVLHLIREAYALGQYKGISQVFNPFTTPTAEK